MPALPRLGLREMRESAFGVAKRRGVDRPAAVDALRRVELVQHFVEDDVLDHVPRHERLVQQGVDADQVFLVVVDSEADGPAWAPRRLAAPGDARLYPVVEVVAVQRLVDGLQVEISPLGLKDSGRGAAPVWGLQQVLMVSHILPENGRGPGVRASDVGRPRRAIRCRAPGETVAVSAGVYPAAALPLTEIITERLSVQTNDTGAESCRLSHKRRSSFPSTRPSSPRPSPTRGEGETTLCTIVNLHHTP